MCIKSDVAPKKPQVNANQNVDEESNQANQVAQNVAQKQP
jgi:hypothetical protein